MVAEGYFNGYWLLVLLAVIFIALGLIAFDGKMHTCSCDPHVGMNEAALFIDFRQ